MARGSEKGMVIYREQVEVRGWPGGTFEKICRLYKNDGIFGITYPVRVVQDNLTQVDEVYSTELKKAEEKFNEEVGVFEALGEKYTSVICFNASGYTYGTDTSMTIHWAVFRKIERPDRGVFYFYERGFNPKEKYAGHGQTRDVHNWSQVPYSKEAEQFFRNLTKNLIDLQNKLNDFLSQPFDIKKAQKLIG